MNDQDVEEIDEPLELLLNESEKKNLNWFISLGLKCIKLGIQNYYTTNESNTDMQTEKFYNGLTFKQSFVVVILLHLIAVGGIVYFSTKKTAIAKQLPVEPPIEANAYPIDGPTPVPSPTPVPPPSIPPRSSQQTDWPKSPKSKYTSHYIVRKGDTFNGIVRRFKLDPIKLKKINNIKDENKIVVGQTLKLM